jgi:hypothetical protein
LAVSFEELDGAFVSLGCGTATERAQISAPSGFRI